MKKIIVNGMPFIFSKVDESPQENDDISEIEEVTAEEDVLNAPVTSFENDAELENLTGNAFGKYKRRLGQANQCLRPGCLKTFRSPDDLQLHVERVHNKPVNFIHFAKEVMNWNNCPSPDCGKSFTFRKQVIKHYREVHDMAEEKRELMRCSLCYFATVNEGLLVRHIESNHTKTKKLKLSSDIEHPTEVVID